MKYICNHLVLSLMKKTKDLIKSWNLIIFINLCWFISLSHYLYPLGKSSCANRIVLLAQSVLSSWIITASIFVKLFWIFIHFLSWFVSNWIAEKKRNKKLQVYCIKMNVLNNKLHTHTYTHIVMSLTIWLKPYTPPIYNLP